MLKTNNLAQEACIEESFKDFLKYLPTMKNLHNNLPKFSRVIAGTMTWGRWGKQMSTSEMAGLIEFCLENEITTFDHADIYGDYLNESEFGKARIEADVKQSNFQIITKCGIQMTRGRDNRVKHYQYDTEYIVRSAERSLEQLQLEYIDLFLLHRPSPLMNPELIAIAIDKLLASGKIKSFGVSNFSPSQISLLETMVPVAGNQVEFSLTHTEPMYNGTIDDCIINKRLAMAWSPLGSFFREENEQNSRIKEIFQQVKEKYSADESQLLIAFISKHPANIYPVLGTTQKDRLVDSKKATTIDLELQDWFLLLEASQGHRVP